jgi:hypothetical protein
MPLRATAPMPRTNWLLRFPWLLAALAAYYLPWINNRAAALSANADVLAEWTSLHSTVREANIPFLVPFLLRAVLGGLALLFAIRALKALSGRARWGYTFLALLLAITLLPPLEFFRGAWDDPNHRQQFALSIATLAGLVTLAAASSRGLPWNRLVALEIAIGVLAVISAVGGEVLALGVIRSLGIVAPIGVGAVAVVVCLAMSSLAVWWRDRSPSNDVAASAT